MDSQFYFIQMNCAFYSYQVNPRVQKKLFYFQLILCCFVSCCVVVLLTSMHFQTLQLKCT